MAAGNIEQINVIANFIDKFTKPLKRAQDQMKKVNKTVNAQANSFAKLTKAGKLRSNAILQGKIAQQGFFKTMRMGVPELKKFNEQGRRFTTVGGRMANRFRLATHGLKGFRMEMLGVMFFGMMLQRTFMGLLQPVLEAFGVFDLFRIMLLVLFLPVMEMIFPVLLKIMDWFITLPDPVKKAMGIFVLLGAAVGAILFVIGAFALGIGSVAIAFGFLLSPIGLIIGALTLLLGMIGFGFFSSLIEGSEGATDALTTFGISSDAITKIVDKIKEAWPKIKQFFVNMAGKIWRVIKDGFPEYLERGREIMGKILEGIKEKLPEIEDMIRELIESLGKFVEENWGLFVEIGVRIGLAIVEGIGNALSSWIDRFDNWLESKTGGIIKADPFGWKELNKPITVQEEPQSRSLTEVLGTPGDPFGLRKEGIGENVSLKQENHFYGFTIDELNRSLDDRDRRLVDDVRRLVKE